MLRDDVGRDRPRAAAWRCSRRSAGRHIGDGTPLVRDWTDIRPSARRVRGRLRRGEPLPSTTNRPRYASAYGAIALAEAAWSRDDSSKPV